MSTQPEPLATPIDRRKLIQLGGLAGATLLGGLLEGCGGSTSSGGAIVDNSPTVDEAVLNFALNLEYLEAEYYSLALTGAPLTSDLTGVATSNVVVKTTSTTLVTFTDPTIYALAQNLNRDETNHVRFLRGTLGVNAVAQPAINLLDSFNAAYNSAASTATATTVTTGFDPFANELNFLIGAFVFEDVGVTAYRNGATLLTNKDYLSAAAGILGVEAYHAGAIRTLLYERRDAIVEGTGLSVAAVVQAISNLRDTADNSGKTGAYSNGKPYTTAGGTDDDQPIVNSDNTGNVVPVDAKGLVFARTVTEVLPIVYLGSKPSASNSVAASFFPNGLNGMLK